MKNLTFWVFASVAWAACQESTPAAEFTGNQTVYELSPGSSYNISGTVTLKERKDGFATVVVALKGTSGNEKHPVHVHLGSIETPDADVAALLSPVDASSGLSETILKDLTNETKIRYIDLLDLDACIKIHQSEAGDGRNVILAGGNIGAAFTRNISTGRTSLANCKSE